MGLRGEGGLAPGAALITIIPKRGGESGLRSQQHFI